MSGWLAPGLVELGAAFPPMVKEADQQMQPQAGRGWVGYRKSAEGVSKLLLLKLLAHTPSFYFSINCSLIDL